MLVVDLVISAHVLELDQLLSRLASARNRLTLPLAQAAERVTAESSWVPLGYRSSDDFAREHFQRSGGWLRSLAALQRSMQRVPALRHAVAGSDGDAPLGRAAALEIHRHVDTHNVAPWLERARKFPIRMLRESLRKSHPESHEAHADAQRSVATSDKQSAESIESTCLRVSAPPEVHVAHHDVLELHRAVSGAEVSARDFFESLVGESRSSGRCRSMESREDTSQRRIPGADDAVNASLRRRQALERLSRSAVLCSRSTSAKLARRTLRRAEHWIKESPVSNRPARPERLGSEKLARRRVHELREILSLENEIEARIAELLLELSERRVWRTIGFRGVAEYAEERLGCSRNATYRRVRLARRLKQLAEVRRAYEAGHLGLESALWVASAMRDRIPNREIQFRWIEHASTTTLKRLRDEERILERKSWLDRADTALETTLRHARPRGAGRAPNPSDRCHAPEPKSAGIPDDITWQGSLRRVPGQTQALLAALGAGVLERVVMRGALVERPMRWILPADLAHDVVDCIESARRALADGASRAHTVAQEARLAPSERLAREFVGQCKPIPAWVGYLALLEEYAGVWDDPTSMSRRPHDAILARAGWRCTAPGCSARRNLQVHHLQHRARGGGDEPTNLDVVCAYHHLRGEHGVLAHCRGQAPLDVIWRLGTRELGVWYRNERRLASEPSALT